MYPIKILFKSGEYMGRCVLYNAKTIDPDEGFVRKDFEILKKIISVLENLSFEIRITLTLGLDEDLLKVEISVLGEIVLSDGKGIGEFFVHLFGGSRDSFSGASDKEIRDNFLEGFAKLSLERFPTFVNLKVSY
ncbi:hypothetical protein KKH36_01065 [Patescibacteria group bacterium]|nr:hypothetical protein [Patescibacteria group bacterium]